MSEYIRKLKSKLDLEVAREKSGPIKAPPSPTGGDVIMSGDCGGTNSRLTLLAVPLGYEPKMGERPSVAIIFSKTYANAEHASVGFEGICKTFLKVRPRKQRLGLVRHPPLPVSGPLCTGSQRGAARDRPPAGVLPCVRGRNRQQHCGNLPPARLIERTQRADLA